MKKVKRKHYLKIDKTNDQIDLTPTLPDKLLDEESLLSRVGKAVGRGILSKYAPHAARQLDHLDAIKRREEKTLADKDAKEKLRQQRDSEKHAKNLELINTRKSAALEKSKNATLNKLAIQNQKAKDIKDRYNKAGLDKVSNHLEKDLKHHLSNVYNNSPEVKARKEKEASDLEKSKFEKTIARKKMERDWSDADREARRQEQNKNKQPHEMKKSPEERNDELIRRRETFSPNRRGEQYHVKDSNGKIISTYKNKQNAEIHLSKLGQNHSLDTVKTHNLVHYIVDKNGNKVENIEKPEKGSKGRPANSSYTSKRHATARLKELEKNPEHANNGYHIKTSYEPIVNRPTPKEKQGSSTGDAVKELNASRPSHYNDVDHTLKTKPNKPVKVKPNYKTMKKIIPPSKSTGGEQTHVTNTKTHTITTNIKPKNIYQKPKIKNESISDSININYNKYIQDRINKKVKDGKKLGNPVIDDKDTDASIERKIKQQIFKYRIESEDMSELYKFTSYGDVPPQMYEAYAKALSKGQKSEIVKKAESGEDLGDKGKNFKKIEDKAEKEYGSKEAGKKVAGAIFWKKMSKESLDESKKGSYELYHDQYTHAINHALDHHSKTSGLQISDDTRDTHIATGPRKPAKDETVKHNLPAKDKDGKDHMIHIQIYNRGSDKKPYELNTYSSKVGKKLNKESVTTENFGDGTILETKNDYYLVMFDHGIEKIKKSDIRDGE